MRPAIRIVLVLGCLAAVVAGVGLVFTGLPARAKPLTTGLGGSPGHGINVLRLAADTLTRVNTWAQEDTTAARPTLTRRASSIELAYAGTPGDTGGHRKVEIFQAIHRVAADQRWVFSVLIRGAVVKSYADVGMEWFGKNGRWMDEKDVYPPLDATYQRVTVAAVLPSGARYLAVYVQLAEINPATRIDISASGASLIKTAFDRSQNVPSAERAGQAESRPACPARSGYRAPPV
jgi:hypothetical protein